MYIDMDMDMDMHIFSYWHARADQMSARNDPKQTLKQPSIPNQPEMGSYFGYLLQVAI